MRAPRLRPPVRVPLLLVCVVLAAGCTLPEPRGIPTTGTTTPTGSTTTPTPESYEARFDGGRALDMVRAQVERPDGSPRYRIPATEGNNETARFIADTLDALGFAVQWHHFNATYGCAQTPMHNVVAERAGTTGRVLVLAAHYDSRPVADKDPDPARRADPVLGANDGGSGVGVLLELARVLPPTEDAVRLVFFDGEDGGGYLGNACTSYILGSRAYAASLSDEEQAAIRAFVLVDMVGDPDLVLPLELRSRDAFPELQEEVYAAGQAAGHGDVFVRERGWQIEDDHVPFIEAGIPAIDLIHTSLFPNTPVFPAWHHTLADDMDVVSAQSLAAVGRSLETWLASY